MEKLPKLSAGQPDHAAAILRAISSAVPIVGGALAEVFTAVIPGQQIERFRTYLEYLAGRLEELEIAQAAIINPNNAALVEDGWRKSRETNEQQRIKNIARCVAEGISSTERSQLHKERVLGIVAQLDAEEMTLLAAFKAGTLAAFDNIRPPPPTIGASREVMEANAMWEAMITKLKTLELISFRQRTKKVTIPNERGRDEEVEIPEVDHWGEPRGSNSITALGTRVLESVGIDVQKQSGLSMRPFPTT